ncbi:uncharacterized protein LOC132751878 [Ruditapes philippinarum]|uniref:uncharacterized protein LOC132751878 n=1 Tax=Ruditapes philippinarum TaxID=129788 RepID=UPI00295B423A|nr:uncharacterized protein LOC132751878 [Ruditapes philippinarum]
MSLQLCRNNFEVCCKTCQDIRLDIPGCPWGDEYTDCTQSHCANDFSKCCQTCAATNTALTTAATSTTSTSKPLSTAATSTKTTSKPLSTAATSTKATDSLQQRELLKLQQKLLILLPRPVSLSQEFLQQIHSLY